MRGKAYRVARQTQGLTGQSLPNFIGHRGDIESVKARIRIAILASVMECQRTE